MREARAARLESLQVLRGLAATAVVLHHAFSAAAAGAPAGARIVPPRIVALGAAGVDLFFILSGFLMVYIAAPWFARERSVGSFVAQRLIRVWPPYALATLAACIPLAAGAIASGRLPFDLQPIRLAGIVFLPSFDRQCHIVPILPVGWTLHYEILFYACFALVLMGSPRWALARLAGLLAALVLLGLLLPGTVLGAFLGNMIVAEFLIGALIAHAWRAGRLPSRHGLPWLGAGLALLLLNAAHPGLEAGNWRAMVFGMPMALVFVAFLALDGVGWPALLRRLGDASYSIYLTHLLVIDALRGTLQGMTPGPSSALLLAVLALAMGMLCFAWIERPLLRACQRLYNRLTGEASPPPMVARGSERPIG